MKFAIFFHLVHFFSPTPQNLVYMVKILFLDKFYYINNARATHSGVSRGKTVVLATATGNHLPIAKSQTRFCRHYRAENLCYQFGHGQKLLPQFRKIVGLVFLSGKILNFPCHSERSRRIQRSEKNKQDMRLTAGCFDRLNMTRARTPSPENCAIQRTTTSEPRFRQLMCAKHIRVAVSMALSCSSSKYRSFTIKNLL